MNIIISKSTAKALSVCIWMGIGACLDEEKKGVRDDIMKKLGITGCQLYGLVTASEQIQKKLNKK